MRTLWRNPSATVLDRRWLDDFKHNDQGHTADDINGLVEEILCDL